MSNSLTATVESKIKCLHQSPQVLSITYTGAPTLDYTATFSSSAISKVYFNTYTVGTSPTSIDLTTLTDPFGVALSFGSVVDLLIVNNDTTNALEIGGGSNGLFTLLPVNLAGQVGGSSLHWTTPITVNGTHKILTLQATASTISVSVFVIGS